MLLHDPEVNVWGPSGPQAFPSGSCNYYLQCSKFHIALGGKYCTVFSDHKWMSLMFIMHIAIYKLLQCKYSVYTYIYANKTFIVLGTYTAY